MLASIIKKRSTANGICRSPDLFVELKKQNIMGKCEIFNIFMWKQFFWFENGLCDRVRDSWFATILASQTRVTLSRSLSKHSPSHTLTFFSIVIAARVTTITTEKNIQKKNCYSILLWPSYFNYGKSMHLLGCLKFVRYNIWLNLAFSFFVSLYFPLYLSPSLADSIEKARKNSEQKRARKKAWEKIKGGFLCQTNCSRSPGFSFVRSFVVNFL